MKTNRLMTILMLSAALCATPVYAQGRGGSHGGGRSSSSSHSSSSSSSRGSSHSSSSSSSRGSSYSGSSSSSRSSSYSSPSSRSSSYSSPSSRSSSYSSPSSRSSHSSSTPSYRSSSHSSSNAGHRGTVGSGSTPRHSAPEGRHTSDRSYNSSRSVSTPSSVGAPTSRTPSVSGRSHGRTGGSRTEMGGNGRGTVSGPGRGSHGQHGVERGSGAPTGRSAAHQPSGRPYHDNPGHGYARPGHPGHVPPAHRPIHPAPYFHHPYHHGMMHMHHVHWHRVPPRPIFCPGFWVYCNSYWYDYHVTDVVVVRQYVRETYNVDMVSFAVSGDIMYAIVNDNGTTYMQVYDINDKLLAEHEISRKYIKTEIDRENGGCWIFKKKDRDPMLFLYVDGELLIYEAD